ncbi:hypothetical protein N780_10210 [Pontibacillus chungwhensis BH030062]|uniref:Uncharacterized protein n=1 Tax=Pontibacillus chungwhensis BH030062 TaxID=1385513 RepID=A0A0A2UMZ1_9BACI|nr:N-6 DNA methylase [Pontibacillus chungwhensis]KGP89662.1 hypothetical protein N780_10210 [Pontibacillus chungwhensis BH030062]
MKTQVNNLFYKKRLGQYFSGDKLANLLAAFTLRNKENLDLIDPMCGVGDMLLAGMDRKAKVTGIELDEHVYKLCQTNTDYKYNQLINGNSFSLDTIKDLSHKSFDVVMTNPPYVRYQYINQLEDFNGINDKAIRNSLLDIVDYMQDLQTDEKDLFKTVIKNYSGLSDLAVPSWILCAMLTKKEGKLALVVPESWLNRDYSNIIQYLLYKLFDIEYVIEDTDRKWFEDAQVKTNLVIAKRTYIKDDILQYFKDKYYTHVQLSSQASRNNSLVGGLYPKDWAPEEKFVKDIDNGLFSGRDEVHINKVNLSKKLNNLISEVKEKKWFIELENHLSKVDFSSYLPIEQQQMLHDVNLSFKSLFDFNVNIGQGLRTGYNKFFYVDFIQSDDKYSVIQIDNGNYKQNITVSNHVIRTVIRKQAELPVGNKLNEQMLTGRVLLLQNSLKREDYYRLKELGSHRGMMDEGLNEYINSLEKTNIGTEEAPKFIYELSAVKPNIKKMKQDDPDTENYWYMLPELANRHLPDILVPRVNSRSPKFVMNTDSKVVVDANFSTINCEDSPLDKYFLIAFLNCQWTQLSLELIGNVMGGGALKVEATHLKKLPIPILSDEQIASISDIGHELSKNNLSSDIANDKVLEIVFKEHALTIQKQISTLLHRYQNNRKKK